MNETFDKPVMCNLTLSQIQRCWDLFAYSIAKLQDKSKPVRVSQISRNLINQVIRPKRKTVRVAVPPRM